MTAQSKITEQLRDDMDAAAADYAAKVAAEAEAEVAKNLAVSYHKAADYATFQAHEKLKRASKAYATALQGSAS